MGCTSDASARENLARGAAVTALTTFSGYSTANVVDGDTSTALGAATSWANTGSTPTWLELDLGGSQRFGRIDVITTAGYEIRDFDLEYWNGTSWVNLASVRGNTATEVVSTFPRLQAQRVRLVGLSGPSQQMGYVRVNEIEIFDNQAVTAVATATSTFSGYSVDRLHDASRSTALGGSTSWANDGTLPDSVELAFDACRIVDRIELYSTSNYELRDYDLQAWDGAAWQTIASVRDNAQASLVHSFAPVYTDRVRVLCLEGSAQQAGYARINELEVY